MSSFHRLITLQQIALKAIQEMDEEEDDLDLDFMRLSLIQDQGLMDVSTDDEETTYNGSTDDELSENDMKTDDEDDINADDEDDMNDVMSNEPPPKRQCF